MSKPKSLLIVDDSVVSRQILRNRFGRLRPDWTIYDSDNGADALHLAKAIKPDFVTMDVNMPNMSGLVAAERLLQVSPHIRIVMISANVQDATINHSKAMGCGFIEKPITEEGVIAAIVIFEGADQNV